MPSLRIKKDNKIYPVFLTFTVVNWFYIFDRHNRWQILESSFQYCIDHKNLKIFGFIFMLNHIHLIIQSPDSIGFVRDFKKFTSKQIKLNIRVTEPDVLHIFTNRKAQFNLWQKTNMPIILQNKKILLQKINYIHNNPVRKGYVSNSQYWKYSSANPDTVIKIETI
jgi:REP-associated tyrosine transposase